MFATRMTKRTLVAVISALLVAGTAGAAASGALTGTVEVSAPGDESTTTVVDDSTTTSTGDDSTTTTAAGDDSTTTTAAGDDSTTSTTAVDDSTSTTAAGDESTTAANAEVVIEEPTTTVDTRGPDATGPAAFGLCTAWGRGAAKNTNNPAFGALLRAAEEAGTDIDGYCADLLAGHEADEADEVEEAEEAEEADESDATDDQDGQRGNGNGNGNGIGKGHDKG